MNKTLLFSLLALLALTVGWQVPAEAKERCRHCKSHFQIGIGSRIQQPQTYVVRRYAPPPVIVVPPAGSYAPIVAYPSPYVEEVYLVPSPAPVSFGGLSFSWNFFK